MGVGAGVFRRRRPSPNLLADFGDYDLGLSAHSLNGFGASGSSGGGGRSTVPVQAVVSHGSANEAFEEGFAKIRCQKCSLIWKVHCGTTVFTCASCGSKVMVALAAVAQQASNQVDKHLRTARRELQAIMEQQAEVSAGLWQQLEEELGLAQALWESLTASTEASDEAAAERLGEQCTAQVLLREAVQARDGAQVTEALAYAAQTGLPPPSQDVQELLTRLKLEEDLEVLWRCFMRALDAEDAIDLDFWCEEATAQELFVPEEVRRVVRSLRGAERARMAELEYKWSFDARVQDALNAGDEALLVRLVVEAESLGADAATARGALASMRADTGGSSGSGQAAASAAAPPRASSEGPGEALSPRGDASTGERVPWAGDPADFSAGRHEPSVDPGGWGAPPAADAGTGGGGGGRADAGSCGGAGAGAGDSAGAGCGGLSAEELRHQSVASLKAELAKYGLDGAGHCEKDELVRVLLAARRAQAEAEAATGAGTGRPPGASGGGDAGAGTPRAGTPTAGPSFTSAPPPPRAQQQRPSAEVPLLPKAELQGRWFRGSGAATLISGDMVTFSNGASVKLIPLGPDKFGMAFDGRTYHGHLLNGKITWNDGDVWSRTGAGRPGGPTRPQASRPQQGEAPPAASMAKGRMSRAQALVCLELAGNPCEEELRKAYKKAALRWHPDRRQNHDRADEAKERFQEVRAAFEYLQG